MIDSKTKLAYRQKVEEELIKNILPFWMQYTMDHENGGFYGIIGNDLSVFKEAPKGGVLCARILWTYAAAYRIFKKEEYLKMAERAKGYLIQKFWDTEYSGIYWMLDHQGNPINTKKQIYAQAFAIYGLSEYYRATQDEDSLKRAVQLYDDIERHSYDKENKGYIEACSREWKEIEDLRLGDEDRNEKKSMNTHLHIMEAYTNLLRVWNDEGLRCKLKELIEVTVQYIIDPCTYHFKLFFDEYWSTKSNEISYGHDIEGSWLLVEAAEVLGNAKLLETTKGIAVKMAQATYEEGIDSDGGIFNEANPEGIIDSNKEWWPQAEAAIGFLNAWQLTGDDKYYHASRNSWDFIEKHIIDQQKGEWFRGVTKEGKVIEKAEKVGPWKCPYHNSRACFEIRERLSYRL